MQQGRPGSKMADARGIRPNSRQRLKELQKEEQFLSETFKIDNFYNDDKLDIATLKSKITEMKRKGEEVKVNPEEGTNSKGKHDTGITLIPFSNKIQRLYHPKVSRSKILSGTISGRETAGTQRARNPSALSNRMSGNKSNQYEELRESDVRYRKDLKTPRGDRLEANSTRYQSIDNQDRKSKELEQEDLYGTLRSTMIPKIQTIGRRQSNQKSQKSQTLRKLLNSSRLQPLLSSHKKPLTLLQIQSAPQLLSFQQNIQTLWTLYSTLSQIIKTLSYESSSVLNSKIVSQEFIKILCEYKLMVCSGRLEFLVQVVDCCLEFGHGKAVVFSRLLENLSVVYVFLEIVEQATGNRDKFYSSHLVNFVGIASNNLLLLLRLLTLISTINQTLQPSPTTLTIFTTITEFEISSYRCELTSIKETIIRIEHNNSLLSIIQAKLNNQMVTREYHKECFGKFMKGVVVDRLKEEIQLAGERGGKGSRTKPFFQYSYFIFEYLAFHLHHEEYIGFFPKEIETAPEPYLPLPKEFTIIMDPTKILVHTGRQKIFIRAHSEVFLQELLQKCNVVFWSDQMPNQIDGLYNLIDAKNMSNGKEKEKGKEGEIKRLYRHHCYYGYNCHGQLTLIKDVMRIGCTPGKYIVLDGNLDSYLSEEENKTILLPWKGESKDSKLSTVLDILLPFLRQGTDLSKGLLLLKPRLEEMLKSKKRKAKNQQYF